MIFSKKILARAQSIVSLCEQKKIMASVAESCTGGLVAGAITEIPGASACLKVAFVTYSDFMKTRLLGVSGKTLDEEGAVSEETAREMAEGAIKSASADIGVAITGIAGPDGGTVEKPVGLVHFASARRVGGNIHTHHEKHLFTGSDRHAIRMEAVNVALAMLEVEAKQY